MPGKPCEHRIEADLVRVEHRAAAVAWKAIPGCIDHIDVTGTQRHTLFQNARALVDQRIDAALDDFLAGDLLRAREPKLPAFRRQQLQCLIVLQAFT